MNDGGIKIEDAPKPATNACGSRYGTWYCTREPGHEGLCAAHIPVLRTWARSVGVIDCNSHAFAAVWARQ